MVNFYFDSHDLTSTNELGQPCSHEVLTAMSGAFAACRSLGEISGALPLVVRRIRRRRETLIVTAVGRRLLTFGGDHLSLLAVSGAHPLQITALAGDAYHVYAASGTDVYAWRRGNELKHVYRGHRATVHLLLPFGAQIVSIDEDCTLKVRYIKEEDEYLELTFDPDAFRISCITHPATYLNKVLLCSAQGALQLWNLRTSKLVHSFAGWNCGVVVAEQTPAVDVVAFGLADGRIVFHNLKLDRTLLEFTQDWGAVTCLSFRTDDSPTMITGSAAGHLVFWNLEERRVAHQIHGAHVGSIDGLTCFASEPIFATNSSDNSLKIWIFDMPDGGARLLRIREGHHAPPTVVRFIGTEAKTILSAGNDSSLRILSPIPGHQPQSLGRASYNRKASKKKKQIHDKYLMPPITDFSFSVQRDKQWDSIAALHLGLRTATTWSLDKKRMGSHKLVPDKMARSITATCITVSHCGHFVFIGYSNGEVYKFNMQSGIMRGRWGGSKGAHRGPVRGIETDTLNKKLVTVGLDKYLKFWPFDESKSPIKAILLEETVSFTRCHRESSLIAICNEEFSITVVDIDSINIVRKFNGHTSKINDICFSHDSRWLLSAGMDCTIRTWDMLSGELIDIFKVEFPCTSLSMSQTGDFLATAHVGQLGVYLWGNKTLYMHINLRPLDINNISIPSLELPSLIDGESKQTLDFENMDLDDESYESPEQINEDLITLSGLSISRWQNLLNIDVIKQRNKPRQPLKVPKAAPFFLPTLPSIDLKFDLPNQKADIESRILNPDSFLNLTEFGKMLQNATDAHGHRTSFEKLKSLGPSMIDFEISNLSPENGGSIQIIAKFMEMISYKLNSKTDFELAQAYLSLFLKSHRNTIANSNDLGESISAVENDAERGWTKLHETFRYALCTIKSIKDM